MIYNFYSYSHFTEPLKMTSLTMAGVNTLVAGALVGVESMLGWSLVFEGMPVFKTVLLAAILQVFYYFIFVKDEKYLSLTEDFKEKKGAKKGKKE